MLRSLAGRRGIRFLSVALLVALDLWSKHAVFAWLAPEPPGSPPAGLVRDACGHVRLPIAGDWLALMLSRNAGMAFGQLTQFPLFLVIGRVLAVLVLAWLLWRAGTDRKVYAIAFALVLAGAIGNLHDNLFLPSLDDRPFGEVRDFIDVYWPPMDRVPGLDVHFPTFNVADSCISVGAVLLLAASFAPAPSEDRKRAPMEERARVPGPEAAAATPAPAPERQP